MPFDEFLAERISTILKTKTKHFEEKKMFGGICFMVKDKMCLGVVKNDLMARVDPEEYSELLNVHGAREMDFTKRPMKGFIYVDPESLDTSEQLEFWIDKCLDYNPRAKSSKK